MDRWSAVAVLFVVAGVVALIFVIATQSVKAQENGNQVKIACIEAGGSWVDANCIGREGVGSDGR